MNVWRNVISQELLPLHADLSLVLCFVIISEIDIERFIDLFEIII